MPQFPPITWRIAQLIGEGKYEQAYGELELWAQTNPSPETPSRACRYRAVIMSSEFGLTPAVGATFMQSWRLARRLTPGERAGCLADVISFAANSADHHMVQVGRRAWFRLNRRHSDDREVRAFLPYVCSFLGFYTVYCGHPHAALAWFDKAADPVDELEDRNFAAWALAFGARECIKLERFDAAGIRLARAAAILPPNLAVTAIVPCVQAELMLAQERLDEAVRLIDAIAAFNSLVQINVLTACVTARLYGALGWISERQKWCNVARERLGQYPPAWLAREVAMLETH